MMADKPLNKRIISNFQGAVYAAAKRVPRGRVTTYKLLGNYIGCRCYQAIGQALKRNPYAPAVPCHRVIASDLSVGGFAGSRNGVDIERKVQLLEAEGVKFVYGRLQQRDKVYDFTE